MSRAHDRQWTTGGGRFGQRALFFMLRYADVRILYAFTALAVPFYMVVNRRNCRAILSYCRRRLGYGRLKSLAATYRNHFLFGCMMLDRFKLFGGSHPFKVEVENEPLFDALVESRRGFIIAGAHAGNFEIAGYLQHQDTTRIHCVVYGGESEALMAHRAAALARNNIDLIPVNGGMSHLFAIKAALDAGEVVSMAADRMFGSTKSVRCRFMGADADFPIGAGLLAAQMQTPMVGVFAMKEPHMRYRIYVCPIDIDRRACKTAKETAEALTREYAAQLEKVLRRYPLQWFNFFDFWNDDKK